MGCGSTKSTEKQFSEELSKLDSEISSLRVSKEELQNLTKSFTNAPAPEENFQDVQEELTLRLEKLEGMISDIQQFRMSQKLFKTYQVKHPEKMKIQLPDVAASEPESSFKAKNDRLAMIDGRPITEDPMIKEMVAKKRKNLENQQFNRV